MTKRRAPFSTEEALCRIADFIGWDVAALIAGREERTVRQWSEPDVDRHVTHDVAIRLDIAWRNAGGIGLTRYLEITGIYVRSGRSSLVMQKAFDAGVAAIEAAAGGMIRESTKSDEAAAL